MAPLSKKFERVADLVRLFLVPLLERGLVSCVERHRVGANDGVDEFSFGTDAWSLPASLFREGIAAKQIPFSLDGWPCVMKCEGYVIRHHRVGPDESYDIQNCFPGNPCSAAEQHIKQIPIPFKDVGRPPETNSLVLAFMANPNDGLCAAYLASVGDVSGGKVNSWNAVVELWRRNRADSAAAPGVVAPEVSPRPVVRMKKEPDAQ
jgi:hypothetical protein